MAKSVKAGGYTVEQAIQNGLIELQATRDQVEVELLNGTSDSTQPVMVQLTVREESENQFAPISAAAPAAIVPPKETAPLTVDEIAKEVLETLLRGMAIRSQVVIHRDTQNNDGPDFVLDIVGADLGVLIGRRGETLRDLEYLARLIVAVKTHSNERFMVDVEGYRMRRELTLRALAKRMADRVKQNRQPITLEAMPPNERRIIHVTLKEHPTVKTQSIGEGDRRRVMILPK
ncbi:KH domain-containing protein [Anaerolineae bacterium CFX7]|nr:KH domain-containing protein [Anaerolineae bacterium CFX7]